MNKVLNDDACTSRNFYFSDLPLQHFLSKEISVVGLSYMHDKLINVGLAAATIMNPLSLTADKQEPKLIKRNFYGEEINKIEFHPAYHELKKIAVESEMFRVKWNSDLRNNFKLERHALGFSSAFIFAMSECGLFCPLCMTDGVARLIDRYCSKEDKIRLLPHIGTSNVKDLYTGAMFLTEKSGGSDVGANLVTATHINDNYYNLNGEKWFCSNADAELIFALARIDPEIKGTKGLSIFLIEKEKPDGSKNDLGYIRIKNKLGVRSMASAECMLTNTVGKLIGKKGQGFKIMTEMINLSRLYNSVAAVASMRRAMIESYQFLKYRTTFGTNALEHPLIRTKFEELAAKYYADFYLTWRAIKAIDSADNGNKKDEELLRLITPMTKKSTAATCVYSIRESMELMGGMGYIEDGVIPKILRDAMVLPIWEGSGNIMTLDMLRALYKSDGFKVICEEIHSNIKLLENNYQLIIKNEIEQIQLLINVLKEEEEQEVIEATAEKIFENLTIVYQISLLSYYRDEISKQWLNTSICYLINTLKKDKLEMKKPLDKKTIEKMIAWEINV
ncbi:MAG: acyl-CoA dehydrogenase family protein [Saprospiraceae bacterium]|nr:acyl-CoA dehydrogenase family protein [Saprospiraceae bacterium]